MTLPAFDTANHTEHAALARCVLGVMSRDAGFDFQSPVDGCGGNMWIWHRKQSRSHGIGLKLIHAAEEEFSADKLPANWRDHVAVVTRQRQKVKLDGVADKDEDVFDQLAMAHRRVDPDDKHKAIMDEISRRGYPVT